MTSRRIVAPRASHVAVAPRRTGVFESQKEPLIEPVQDGLNKTEYARERGRRFNEIIKTMEMLRDEELSTQAIQLLRKAYRLAIRAHNGQTRKNSTVPYAFHCLQVALICAKMGADYRTVATALLHDTLEQGRIGKGVNERPITLRDIQKKGFGDTITEWVSRLTPLKLIGSRWIYPDAPNYAICVDEYKDRRRKYPEIEDEKVGLEEGRIAGEPILQVIKMADSRSNFSDIENLEPDRREKYCSKKMGPKMPLLRVLHPPLFDEISEILHGLGHGDVVPRPHRTNLINNALLVVPPRTRIVEERLIEFLPRPAEGSKNTFFYMNDLHDLLSEGMFEIGCPRITNGGGRPKSYREQLGELYKDMGLDIAPGTSFLPKKVGLSEMIYEATGIGGSSQALRLEMVEDIAKLVLQRLLIFHTRHVTDKAGHIVFLLPDDSMHSIIAHFAVENKVEVIKRDELFPDSKHMGSSGTVGRAAAVMR